VIPFIAEPAKQLLNHTEIHHHALSINLPHYTGRHTIIMAMQPFTLPSFADKMTS